MFKTTYFDRKNKVIYKRKYSELGEYLLNFFVNATGMEYIFIKGIPSKTNGTVSIYLKDHTKISNKKQLNITLKGHNLLPKTYNFPEDYLSYKKNCKNKKMILKTNAQRQKGIFITYNIQTSYFLNNENFIVAQEFLENSYLYHNHKIATRLFLFIHLHNNKCKYYVHNDGFVYYSSDKNPDISSFYSCQNLYEKYPISINEVDKNLFNSCLYTMKIFKNILERNKTFRTSDNNHYIQLFGVDFFVDKNYNSHILELNCSPGMISHNNKDKIIRDKLIENYVNLLNFENIYENNLIQI